MACRMASPSRVVISILPASFVTNGIYFKRFGDSGECGIYLVQPWYFAFYNHGLFAVLRTALNIINKISKLIIMHQTP
jgi:hypothetical protein